MAFEPNPSLFDEMQKPFESADAANAAMAAFQVEFSEIRKKHKIPTIIWAAEISCLSESGERGTALISGGYGDAQSFEALAAWLLGREQLERQERIMSLLDSAKTIKKGRRSK